MGLVRCFSAESVLAYELWDGIVTTPHYNDYLVTPPRLYDEEPYSFLVGDYLGVLFVEAENTATSISTIRFLSAMNAYHWPSWSVDRWSIDGQYGRLMSKSGTPSGASVVQAIGEHMVWEPAGYLWWNGIHSNAYHGGAVLLDKDTLAATETVILARSFGDPDNEAFQDFNVDRAADRLFARLQSENVGRVGVWKLSTQERIADLWTPNATAGIVLTHDGFVYVIDVADWICVYDYEGTFYRAMRNPRKVDYPGGVVYGWDKFYKRLLFLGGTAPAEDGASTLRVEAFYPVAEPAILTAPIPRVAPRKGRTISVLSRLAGEGAEPLAGRAARLNGTSALSDQHGDVVVNVTPSDAGSLDLTVEA